MLYSSTSSSVIASLIRSFLSLLGYWLWRCCSKAPNHPQCKEIGSTTSEQPRFDWSIWSCPLYFIALLFPDWIHWPVPWGQVQKNILIWCHNEHAPSSQSTVSVTFAYRIYNGVWVTHYVITVLDSSLAHVTRLPRMICGSLVFACWSHLFLFRHITVSWLMAIISWRFFWAGSLGHARAWV